MGLHNNANDIFVFIIETREDNENDVKIKRIRMRSTTKIIFKSKKLLTENVSYFYDDTVCIYSKIW